MSGTMIPCTNLPDATARDPRSDIFPVAEKQEVFEDTDDVAGAVDAALDEHVVVPICEGTVQIRRFESPLLQPVPSTAPPARKTKQPIPTAPSWLLQITGLVPARHEKAVVAGILFFFLFGVLSFLGGLTMLLFIVL
jgi:hypothetical protein